MTKDEKRRRQLAAYHAMTPEQKAARLAKERAYYHANKVRIRQRREKEKDKRREWNRAYVAKNRQWFYEVQAASRFKVTRAEIQAIRQSSATCEICGAEPEPTRRLAIDHCHDTGALRGMLCHACNCGLGNFRDNEALLTAAASYLSRKRKAIA